MATMPLLQTVKQNAAALTDANNPLAAQAGLQPTGGTSTQQTANLMGVAQTGKEQAPAIGGQAKLSALGEKLANVNTLMTAGALQQAGTLQSTAQIQQAEAQQQQFQGQANQISQEHLNAVETYNNQVAGMLQQESDQIQQMTLSDDKSKVEQMGLMLRLGNQSYIDQLNSQATKSRLNDKAAFQQALNQSVFAQETNLLGSSLEFRNYLAADQRATTQALANMDINFALQVATVENKAAATTTMWNGIGTLAGAGVSGAAGAYASSSAATDAGEATARSSAPGNLVMQSSENADDFTPAVTDYSQAGSASSLGLSPPSAAPVQLNAPTPSGEGPVTSYRGF